jgi:hypothetical protein
MAVTAITVIIASTILSLGFMVDGWTGVAICAVAAGLVWALAVVNIRGLRREQAARAALDRRRRGPVGFAHTPTDSDTEDTVGKAGHHQAH